MATLNWSDLVELTHDQGKQDLLVMLEAQGFQGSAWQEGDPALFGVEIGAEIESRNSKYAVFLRDMGLNATATGEALTKLSKSHFGNDRNPAVETQRSITLACAATSGPYVINVGDLVLTEPGGQTFRNVAGLSFSYPANLTSGGSLTLLFEAEVAGAAGNVANDTVTQFVTTLAGVTVTDDTLYRTGENEESDERLRLRNETTAATRSLEPIDDTIENLVLELDATLVTPGINSTNPRGPGTFDVYLAQELTTASGAQVLAVQAALDARVMGDTSGAANTRPGYAIAAPTLALDLIGTVYYAPTFAAADVQTGVLAALTAYLKTIPMGGFDYAPGLADVVPKNELENVIRSATVNGQAGAIRTVSLSTPSGDVSVSAFEKVIQGTWALTYTPTLS